MLPDLDFPEGIPELLADFSVAGQRAVNWNILMLNGKANAAEVAGRQLAVSNLARERGGEVIALMAPVTPGVFMNLKSGVTFDALPGQWREIFKLPLERRMDVMRDPAVRRQMADDLETVPETAALKTTSRLENFTVISAEASRECEGRRIGAIAAERGVTPIDAMFDIALADNLETIFQPDLGGDDAASWDLRARLYADDRTLVGASDAGAHLDVLDSFSFSTTVLSRAVREQGIIGLEGAVHELTLRPATYFGLVDRGALREGFAADIVIFDPATIGRGPTYRRHDVPGATDYRLYADAIGIDRVLVNGATIVLGGEHTGALPGKLVRSPAGGRA
jgi:N-acyl-D-aspartate/D-glutamate deacylase